MTAPAHSPGPAVELTDATRVHRTRDGEVRALDGFTWRAPRGLITCVLGPNGAGKTTAMECISGLQRPDSGSVRVLGRDPWDAPADHRSRVGVMLQDGGLPNTATVRRVLTHLSRLYADPLPLPELVRTLDLSGLMGRTIRRLSGGQRQRVAMAAALLGRPELALLDEPSAGLDPHARREIHDMIRRVRDQATTVIVTTHSFEEAERLADRITIVARGRVVADGTAAEIAGDEGLEQRYFALTTGTRR